MIYPTRARVVLFKPAETDHIPTGGEALAAIIVHVHSAEIVNLSVFDAFGRQHARPSVQLLQDGDEKPKSGAYAEWMAYQKGQAAKTESLEQKLASVMPSPAIAACQPEQQDMTFQVPSQYTPTFQGALAALKDGRRVARAGWNGRGMFAYMVPAASYPAQTGAAKAHFGEGAMVPYNAYFALKGVDDTVNTWVPSISDLLAEDWAVIE